MLLYTIGRCLITGRRGAKQNANAATLFFLRLPSYLLSHPRKQMEQQFPASLNFQGSKKKLPVQQVFLDSPAQWPMQQW
jgi:hypothetical protein